MSRRVAGRRRVCLSAALLVFLLQGANGQEFYRVNSGGVTAFSAITTDGWLTWSNAVPGVTCMVERVVGSLNANPWASYVQHPATAVVMRVRCFDPSPPPGMVFIPGGMNAGTDPDFGPYVLVQRSFYMDQYEVTKALWDAVRDWNGGNGYSFDNPGLGKAVDHPVYAISWFDCVKWCNARSQMDGLQPVYFTDMARSQLFKTGQVSEVYIQESANGYRLPERLQWQFAARGGALGRRFPWADTNTIQHVRANYWSSILYSYDTSLTRGYHPSYTNGVEPYTSPVGSFAANGYGLYDLVGNVWEWCEDWYPGLEGSKRVVHGGAWNFYASYSRVGFPYDASPGYTNDNLGFRTIIYVGTE